MAGGRDSFRPCHSDGGKCVKLPKWMRSSPHVPFPFSFSMQLSPEAFSRLSRFLGITDIANADGSYYCDTDMLFEQYQSQEEKDL